MITKAIIFDGKPGSGPEPEKDPEPFVSTICVCPMGETGSRKDCHVHGTDAFTAPAPAALKDRPQPRLPDPSVQPVKRGPGRPRKTPA